LNYTIKPLLNLDHFALNHLSSYSCAIVQYCHSPKNKLKSKTQPPIIGLKAG